MPEMWLSMAKFKIINTGKKDNSHPAIKIALREWAASMFINPSVLDVYGGGGMMFDKAWNKYNYHQATGEALQWLNNNQCCYDIYDVDPYASPFEAMEIIFKKTTRKIIGFVCTDGCLRRAAMMRTHLPKFICDKCGWSNRDGSLMAAIYHQYPAFIRHVIKSIAPGWDIIKLAVKYGVGTWKQATVYFACICEKHQ